MFSNFKNARTKATLAKMLGTLTPTEICDVIEDKEVARTDIPTWTELVIQENCTIILKRLELYNDSIRRKYGDIKFTIQKLSIYHKIWMNWDGNEPCPCERNEKLEFFYDSTILARQLDNKYSK